MSALQERILPLDVPPIKWPIFENETHPENYLTPFCSKWIAAHCVNTTLTSCTQCNMTGAAVFMALVALLGVTIVFGNTLVLLVVRRRSKKNKVESMDLNRVSLAVADLLTGIQLLVVTAYNFAWSIVATPEEMGHHETEYENSAAAIAGSIFFTLTFTASMYNLVFLAGQRLFAFVRPIHYKLQQRRRVILYLFIVWIIAIVSATVPAWFQQYFDFSYYTILFLFYPSLKKDSDSYAPGIIVMTLFYVLPYVLTTCFIIASAIVVHSHLKRAAEAIGKYRSSQSESTEVENKSEIVFLRTTALMQLGFTVTVLPGFVLIVLYYAFAFSYNDIATAYVACIYLSMTNSLVNVLVYSMRDTKFRKEAVKVLCCGCCCGGESYKSVSASSEGLKKLGPMSLSSSALTGNTTGRTPKKSQSSAECA